MARMHRAVAALILLLLAGGVVIAITFLQWRAGKVAMLEPPAASVTLPATSATAEAGGLLLFGDSRIAMWRPLPDRPYPMHVAGFSGWTAIRLVPEFEQALAEYRPAVVLMQLGVNDAVAASAVGGRRREQALRDSIAAIRQMVALAEAQGVGVILMRTVPPIRPDLKRRLLLRGHGQEYVARLNRSIDALGGLEHVQVVEPMAVLKGGESTVPDRFRLDSLHFTPAAYAAMNVFIPPTLEISG